MQSGGVANMKKLSPEIADQIEKLYPKLKSYKKVAKKLNIDKESVKGIIEKTAVGDSKNLRPGKVNPKMKVDPQGYSEKSGAAKAYKLYSELKRPLDVAVELGISADDAMKYQEEYWKLSGAYYLNQIQTIQPDIWNYLELYGRMRMLKLSPDQFVGKLSNLQELGESERALDRIRREVAARAAEKDSLEKEIEKMAALLKQHESELAGKKAERSALKEEIETLESRKQNLVSLLQRLVNSKTMSEMRDMVQE